MPQAENHSELNGEDDDGERTHRLYKYKKLSTTDSPHLRRYAASTSLCLCVVMFYHAADVCLCGIKLYVCSACFSCMVERTKSATWKHFVKENPQEAACKTSAKLNLDTVMRIDTTGEPHEVQPLCFAQ